MSISSWPRRINPARPGAPTWVVLDGQALRRVTTDGGLPRAADVLACRYQDPPPLLPPDPE
jgi:hypothetical protein